MKEPGFVLPGILLLLTLILVGLKPLQDNIILSLRSRADYSLSNAAYNQVSNQALLASLNFESISGIIDRNRCFEKIEKLNRIEVKRKFCSSFYKPSAAILNLPRLDSIYAGSMLNLPALNFSSIFSNPSSCRNLGWDEVEPYTLVDGFVQAARSVHYCSLPLSSLGEHNNVAANLKIESPLILAKGATLSALGFLNALAPIALEGPTHSITAGGNLILNQITASTETQLTLISATGSVEVSALNGPIKLRVYARKESKLPRTAKWATNGFEELIIEWLPLGFIS